MKKTVSILCLFVVVLTGCGGGGTSGSEYVPPKTERLVRFGDPFIMLFENTYYAYGTNAENGIEVYTSDDLKVWERVAALALNKSNTTEDRWFWAPEVYFVNGKFYMYYSANEHMFVATSDSPLGPFKQVGNKPMLDGEKAIDNSLFIDDDGKPYLFFCRFNDGNTIWVAELEDDLTTMKKETMHPCMHVSQDWEKVWPRVNEAAFVVKRDGLYYMTYSGNSYESQFYGVGCATATDIMGEWTKYDNNPLLQKPGELVGVGHSASFYDKEGNYRIVFHAHNNTSNIHPRAMYISTITFDDAGKMLISPDYITPVMK